LKLLVLDKWYIYSWYRTWRRIEKIRKFIEKHNIKNLLILEEQLSSLRKAKKLTNKITRIIQRRKLIDFINSTVRARKQEFIDLARLITSGIINEEDVNVLEYILISDANGKVADELISMKPQVSISKHVLEKANAIVSNEILVKYSFNPFFYAEFVVRKVSKILNLPIEKNQFNNK